MIEPFSSKEVGRELKASDLKLRTVVVVAPPGRDDVDGVTMWVDRITLGQVWFYSGEMRWYVIAFRRSDGTLADDRGRQVRVFEYLGQP